MENKTNGKITNVELDMMFDDVLSKLPYFIKASGMQAKMLKAKFDNLVGEGFTEAQALEIIKIRPLYE